MLVDKIDSLLEYIKHYKEFLSLNHQKLDIFNGNLKEHILNDLREMLSDEYFKSIEKRSVPINVLTRLTDKSAKAYEQSPLRKVDSDLESDKELVDHYVKILNLNSKMNDADEYSFLFKGYALEPFMHTKGPKLRVLPFDRFLPYSDDESDLTEMTIFIKMVGRKEDDKEVYFAYSDDEFISFNEDGEIFERAMIDNDGENPYGIIPFTYGNRAKNQLIPTQDSDTLELSKVIPIFLTDLSGTIMYQCFSVIWGIDIDMQNVTYSPNAIWSLKSDPNSDRTPQVGTLKPQADIDKVMSFITDVFLLWMDTKGIKSGGISQMNKSSLSSGIAKIIDEMDATAIIKDSMNRFAEEESRFWDLMKIMHNYWVDSGLVKGKPRFSDGFSISLEFDDPVPVLDRGKEFSEIKSEVDGGYEVIENALKKLYPRLGENELNERINHYNTWNNKNGMDENEDSDLEEIQQEGKDSNSL